VCFTESRLEHVVSLVQQKGWVPWELLFRRDAIRSLGGSPVWHATHEEIDKLGYELKHWAVRLGAAKGMKTVDWLHEREWRVRTPFSLTPRPRPMDDAPETSDQRLRHHVR
jgi:hypothetical protein